MNQTKPKGMPRWPLFLAAFALAHGQAGCGPGEPEPPPAPPPKPQPAPKVETRSLHELAATDDTDALRQALRLGQAVDALNALGQAPLHVAAMKNKPSNIKALLAHRANLHAKTQKEQVDALYLACAYGSVEAVKLLVAMAANSTPPHPTAGPLFTWRRSTAATLCSSCCTTSAKT